MLEKMVQKGGVMSECKVCAEKQREINRILSSYKKDKKFFWKVIAISNGVWLIIMLFAISGKMFQLLDLIIKILGDKFG